MDKNIKQLVKRISKEAETVEDMEQLLLSELDAYEDLESLNLGHIILYEEPKIMGTDAVVGEVAGMYIAVRQKIIYNKLVSKYCKHN